MADSKTKSNSPSAPPADLGVSVRSWLRRCGEGHKAHEAFECYRDLGGKRSIREVARRLGRWPSQIGGWSGKHQWVERARAYDTSRERIQLEARELVEKQDVFPGLVDCGL